LGANKTERRRWTGRRRGGMNNAKGGWRGLRGKGGENERAITRVK